MKYALMPLVILCVFLFMTDTVYAKSKESSSGHKSYKGAKAIDGDTFRHKGERYRIQQYNAPELGQPGSRKATRNLQKKIDSGDYQWKPVTKDVYDRTIVNEQHK